MSIQLSETQSIPLGLVVTWNPLNLSLPPSNYTMMHSEETELPPELTATLNRIDSFAELRPNWNSYQACQIDPRARKHAREFLRLAATTMQARGLAFVQPFAAPLADGGVQLEWEEGDACIEIEFASNGSLTFLRETGEDQFAEGSTTTEDALEMVVWFHQKARMR